MLEMSITNQITDQAKMELSPLPVLQRPPEVPSPWGAEWLFQTIKQLLVRPSNPAPAQPPKVSGIPLITTDSNK